MTRRLPCVVALCLVACSSVERGGAALPVPRVQVEARPVGLTTTLDASGSTDPGGQALGYTWTLVAAPPGSALKTLGAATSDKASLDADVGGAYQVRLTARAADGRLNAITQTVDVPNDPIFYVQADVDANTTRMQAGLIGSDGRGERFIGCVASIPAGTANMTDPEPAQLAFAAGFVGTTARGGPAPAFVFSQVVPQGVSWVGVPLYADAASDCANRPPVRLDGELTTKLGEPAIMPVGPSLSPNGKRVLFLAFVKDQLDLVTVGVDGRDLRRIRRFPSLRNAMVRPTWVDDQTVAWGENVGSDTVSQIRLFRAGDADQPDPIGTMGETLHDCAAVFQGIMQFELLPNGKILLVAAEVSRQSVSPGATNLYLQPVGTCSATEGKLTALDAGHFVADVALSPDRTRAVFASDEGQTPVTNGLPLTDLYTVALQPGATPQKLLTMDGTIEMGARFVNGGTQVVFTSMPPATNGPPPSATLHIVNADGTGRRTLRASTASPGELHYTLSGSGISGSCAVGGGRFAGWQTAVGGVLALLWLRRRRRAGDYSSRYL